MPTIESLFPIPPDRHSDGMEILDAIDLLYELKDNQYLLDCLDEVIGHVYFDHHENKAFRQGLTNISTVLRAYSNETVTGKLETAIALLENARD